MNAPSHPRIAIDPEICGGRPTIAGTRMRVEDVLEALAEGASVTELLADFPYITAADVRACLAFAATLAKAAAGPNSAATSPATHIPPGSYTLETLPPLSDGARAIIASIDAVAPFVDLSEGAKSRGEAPGIDLEDEGLEGLDVADEGLPGIDPDGRV
jgi:uncharacterized protein (DUF433 family)